MSPVDMTCRHDTSIPNIQTFLRHERVKKKDIMGIGGFILPLGVRPPASWVIEK